MNDMSVPNLNANATASNINVHAPSASRTLLLVKRGLIGIAIFFLLLIGVRTFVNARDAETLVQATALNAQRAVIITHAKAGALTRTLLLPTTLRGANETTLYARANGYLASWHKDIGDQVARGDLLAVIDAPEQEQELAQARAARQQIQAKAALANLTAQRWESLRKKDGVSQHELEEKLSEAKQVHADLDAATANVKRLEQLREFRRVVAPFDGVITRRGVETGDFIAAGEKELFALTQTNPLRLSIWIPQLHAGNIEIGKQVAIEFDGLGDKKYFATIDRIAGGIDAQTRARQVDLILPNTDRTLLPGAYAQARIDLASTNVPLVAPSSVLKSTANGFQVAVVDKDHRIAFRDIRIGRDLGREIEIVSGVEITDLLVVSPSDLLTEGETVKTVAWEDKSKADKSKSDKSKPAAIKSAKDAALTKS